MQKLLKCEKGFALASVLYLVTILFLLATSILLVKYYSTANALSEIGKVKCEYALESGISKALTSSKETLTQVIENGDTLSYRFPDESEAQVTISPWGGFLRVRATGKIRKISKTRTAIAAELPDVRFKNALIFASPSHQLVMTGHSFIKGDVITGLAGATTGTLRDRVSPIKIPVDGTIKKEAAPSLPQFDRVHLDRELKAFDRLLRRNPASIDDSINSLILDGKNRNSFSLAKLSDSIRDIFINGEMTLEGKISRMDNPLRVISNGNLSFADGTQLEGLITVISSSPIHIKSGERIEHAIIYSRRSIIVHKGADVSAQLIAPSITLEGGAIARYPSLVLSMTVTDPDSIEQGILLMSNAQVEGFVGMYSIGNIVQPEPVVTVTVGALVTGALYSDRKVTLDGEVIGTVLTHDFYFYESPTTYLGWLRGGTIDRSALPSGFTTPIGFSSSPRLTVLDWL